MFDNDTAPTPVPVHVAPREHVAASLDELFESMGTRREVLMGILSFCCEERSVAEVEAEVGRLQAGDYSVWSGAKLCAMLEDAGALERLGQARGREPQKVEVDGVAYWQPVAGGPTSWRITAKGVDALEHDDPMARLCGLLAEQERYRPVYRTVLAMCAREGGVDAVSVGKAVDDDPLLQKPRMYAPAFLNGLASCGAVKWTGSAWCATQVGRSALAQLELEA